MALECKIGQYLEWCTDIPILNQFRESFPFFLKGNEYFFRLINEGCWLNLYFKFKNSGCKQNVNYRAKCQIGFKKGMTVLASEKEFTLSESIIPIWTTEMYSLEKKLPSDYMQGNCLKFLFFFEGVTELLHKETGEKGVQTCSYVNAIEPVESASEDFSRLLDEAVKHDAEVKCGEHTIKVHQIILSARSDVFKAMLESDMLEGRTGIIEIQDMDINYAQDFIRYLYTGRMPELTFDKAKVFYEAGDKYAIRSLMQRCSEYLRDSLAPDNAFHCFLLADTHSDQKLKDKIKSFILEKKKYLQDELWLPFSESYPKMALEVYRLSYKRKISETEKP